MSSRYEKEEDKIIIKPDFTKEYENHTRCQNCNRKTQGIDDYKNIRTGTNTKTCLKCRKTVYKSLQKKSNIITKRTNQKDKITIYEERLKLYEKILKLINEKGIEKFKEENIELFKLMETLLL